MKELQLLVMTTDHSENRRKKFVAFSFIFLGAAITALMLLIFLWPVYLVVLFPDFTWSPGEGIVNLFLNILLAVGYAVLVIALIMFMGVAPWIALFIALTIGIPSMAGGIGLLRNRSWAIKLLWCQSLLYLFIFPLGTLLAVLAFRLNNYQKRTRSLN